VFSILIIILAPLPIFTLQRHEGRIFAPMAYTVVSALVGPFQAATGHTVNLQNDTAGALVKKVEAGESFDVLILTPAALRDLAAKGGLAANSITELAKVGIGVAVRQGVATPDISTVEAFKAALLRSKSVAMIDPEAGGSSGIYLARLFERWGIADQIRAKAVLVPGGLVATRVVSGEAELAIHQISEIKAVPDALLVGPLPDEIQNYTVYAAGISAKTRQPDAAHAFLTTLSGLEAAKLLEAKGMLPP